MYQNSFNGKIIKLAIELDIIISNYSLKIILIFIVKIDKIQYLMVYQIKYVIIINKYKDAFLNLKTESSHAVELEKLRLPDSHALHQLK